MFACCSSKADNDVVVVQPAPSSTIVKAPAPVFKVHAIAMSTCYKRVAIVAHLLNVPFELVNVDFAAQQHKSPQWLAEMNPFGQIPAVSFGVCDF